MNDLVVAAPLGTGRRLGDPVAAGSADESVKLSTSPPSTITTEDTHNGGVRYLGTFQRAQLASEQLDSVLSNVPHRPRAIKDKESSLESGQVVDWEGSLEHVALRRSPRE